MLLEYEIHATYSVLEKSLRKRRVFSCDELVLRVRKDCPGAAGHYIRKHIQKLFEDGKMEGYGMAILDRTTVYFPLTRRIRRKIHKLSRRYRR
jgi:hypothetical protein